MIRRSRLPRMCARLPRIVSSALGTSWKPLQSSKGKSPSREVTRQRFQIRPPPLRGGRPDATSTQCPDAGWAGLRIPSCTDRLGQMPARTKVTKVPVWLRLSAVEDSILQQCKVRSYRDYSGLRVFRGYLKREAVASMYDRSSRSPPSIP